MGARIDRHTYVPEILNVHFQTDGAASVVAAVVVLQPAPRSCSLGRRCPCDSLAQIPRFVRKRSRSNVNL
jgi:hypothetical protein